MLASPLSVPRWPPGQNNWGASPNSTADSLSDFMWQDFSDNDLLASGPGMSCPPSQDTGGSPHPDSSNPYTPSFTVQHPTSSPADSHPPGTSTPIIGQLPGMAASVGVSVNTVSNTASSLSLIDSTSVLPIPVTSHTERQNGGGMDVGMGGRVMSIPDVGHMASRAYRRRTMSSRSSEGESGGDVASRVCDVCGEAASGHYFGALVCLPCKSFFIRCTKGGGPAFSSQCGGKCDVQKTGRIRCQYCRFQRCLAAGMYRKEKPEAVIPAEGQMLCKVCNDIANGIHFGVTTCEGCKKFFRRGLKEHQAYVCKANMMCTINPRMRNNCRYCRYRKCLTVGMSRDAIKMGRPKKTENNSLSRPGRPLSTFSTASSASKRKYPGACPYRMGASAERVPKYAHGGHTGEKRGSTPLEQDFSVASEYDPNYLSDEFLEAVSMHIEGQQYDTLKQEPGAALVEAAEAAAGGGSDAGLRTKTVGTLGADECGSISPSSSRDISSAGAPSTHASTPGSFSGCESQNLSGIFQNIPFQTSQQYRGYPQPCSWGRGEGGSDKKTVTPSDRLASFPSVSSSGSTASPKQRGETPNENVLSSEPQNGSSPAGSVSQDCCTSPVSPANSPGCEDTAPTQTGSAVSPPGAHLNNRETNHRQGTSGNDLTGPFSPHRGPPTPAHHQQHNRHQQFGQKDSLRLASRCPGSNTFPAFMPTENNADFAGSKKPQKSVMMKSEDEKQGGTISSDDLFELLESLGDTPGTPGYKTNRVLAGADQAKLFPTPATPGKNPSFWRSGLLSQNMGVRYPKCSQNAPGYNTESRRRVSDSDLDYPVDTKHSRIEEHMPGVAQGGVRIDNFPRPSFPFMQFFRPEYFGRKMQGVHDPTAKMTSGRPSPMTAPVLGAPWNFHRNDWADGAECSPLHRSHDDIYSASNCSPELLYPFRPPAAMFGSGMGVLRGGRVEERGEHCGPVFPPFLNSAVKQEKTDTNLRHHPVSGRCFVSMGNQQFPSRCSGRGLNCLDSCEEVADFNCSLCMDSAANASRSMARNRIDDVSRKMGRHAGFVTGSFCQPGGSVLLSQNSRMASMNSSNGVFSEANRISINSPVEILSEANKIAMNSQVGMFSEASRMSSLNSPTAVSSVSSPRRMPSVNSPTVTSNTPNLLSDSSLQGTVPAPEGAGSVPCKLPAVSVDYEGIMDVNRHFLSLDITCEKNDCCGDTHYDPAQKDCPVACCSPHCQLCQRADSKESQPWRRFCMKRAHRYWHRHAPSALVVHMTPRNQQMLMTVATALGQLHAGLNDVDRDCAAGHNSSEDCQADAAERLYHHGAAITRAARQFLQLIPGCQDLGDDLETLSRGAGFGAAVILISSQSFDAECKRFRQLWTWTVSTVSPLFSFKVHLLTLADRLHDIAPDKMETALLCAISLLSTDVTGLKHPDAVESVRRALLDGLEAYISSRDQWPSVRVKRLFSVMPAIRLVTAWHSGLQAHISRREPTQ